MTDNYSHSRGKQPVKITQGGEREVKHKRENIYDDKKNFE